MGKGGITGKANDPTGSIASGIWNIREQFNAKSSSLWPGLELFTFSSYTFTPAGANGTTGPTLAQCQTAYAGTSWISSYFDVVTQGYQQWTVPMTGTYQIKVAGAQGGSYSSGYGGYGAILQGDVSLTKGDILYMVVGQKGGHTTSSSGGGGGGSFVMLNTISSLLIAAGGGGSSGNQDGLNATTTNAGATGTYSGGTNGSGGTGQSSGAGGGGGYISAGTGGGSPGGAAPGNYINGGSATGGRGGTCSTSLAGSYNWNNLGADQGGFGGGGGGEYCYWGSSGGGGGYSGGGASGGGGIGGGGGSYFDASVSNRYTSNGLYNGLATGISNLGVFNGVATRAEQAASHGYVTITKL